MNITNSSLDLSRELKKKTISNLIKESAEKYKIPERLLHAVVLTESNGNPFAVRYEPIYPYLYKVSEIALKIGATRDTVKSMQMTSFGLCQVMGGVFYELGGHLEEELHNRWASSMTNPELSLKYGCLVLRKKIEKYGENPLDIYAAYNSGTVRKIEGRYINASAVLRFKRIYEKLGE